MHSTNGHGPKKTNRAILYARVSTEEQARSGYSLAQQLEALRAYAVREGYEVLEEVTDPGQSGADLERPGMGRVRDLVTAGGVSVVLAQDRDRFAREPAYLFLLKCEFEERGTKLRALNDRGDDSPEGELMDGIFDQFAKFERAKIAERSRRGLKRKAKEGYVGVSTPNYGFRYNEAHNGLVAHKPEMLVVEKIFRLAAEGLGMGKMQSRLYAEGVPSPKGAPVWDRRVLHDLVMNDVYRPHTFEEIARLVAPEVAARLDPHKEYGISWYGRRKITIRTVSEPDGNGGRRYRKRRTLQWRPKEEWVALPVPAYLPRALVDQARAAMESSKGHERKHLARGWELRGLVRCPCGYKMGTQSNKPKGARTYHYYVCRRRRILGKKSPCSQRSLRATEIEATVWEYVSGLLKNPKKISIGMSVLIDQERAAGARDPAAEMKVWADKIAECARLRNAYQDQQAAGLMTLGELSSKLQELDNTRSLAQTELEALRAREDRVAELEKDRDALLACMEEMVPRELDDVTPEQKNKIYRMLRLEVTPSSEGYKVSCAVRPSSVLEREHRSFPDLVNVLDFKAAARLVLEEVGHPLHYTDITELALESGYLKSRGRTPHNTMRARLSVDVRDNPESLFVQTAPGVYGLKGRVS